MTQRESIGRSDRSRCRHHDSPSEPVELKHVDASDKGWINIKKEFFVDPFGTESNIRALLIYLS